MLALFLPVWLKSLQQARRFDVDRLAVRHVCRTR